MEHKIEEPFTKDKVKDLKAGDTVVLTGIIYTARDAAHKKLVDMIKAGEELPFEIENAAIYYVGPTPEKEGCPIGAAGPTTSYRMDAYAPTLLELGQRIMIGKGNRNKEVIDATVKNEAVYLAAIGGAGALMAQRVISSEIIAFEDLGAEAIRRLEVKDFPLTVVVDSKGTDLYKEGRKNYLNALVK
ncbi:MAG: Fe-S-containing hydro-lyase [Anaerovoracaceae bacterium]